MTMMRGIDQQKSTRKRATTPVLCPPCLEKLTSEHVRQGVRGTTATAISKYLLNSDIDPALVLHLLVAWNRSYCDPPLTDCEFLGQIWPDLDSGYRDGV